MRTIHVTEGILSLKLGRWEVGKLGKAGTFGLIYIYIFLLMALRVIERF